jgi:ATP-dependent RNA helicase RhlE
MLGKAAPKPDTAKPDAAKPDPRAAAVPDPASSTPQRKRKTEPVAAPKAAKPDRAQATKPPADLPEIVLPPNVEISGIDDADRLHPLASFDDLDVGEELFDDIDELGFVQPTPIQMCAIPYAMAGHDMIGCAQTGTGKTAAFLIPIIELMQRRPAVGKRRRVGPAEPRALILAPTRELAQQIDEHLIALTESAPVPIAVLVGGRGMPEQVAALHRGAQVIVATPGRLLDHVARGTLTLRHIEFLVLDEADRMFDMGFAPQVRAIMEHAPRPGKRLTMMFSATMPRALTALANTQLVDPVRIEVSRPTDTADNLSHDVLLVPQGDKVGALLGLIDDHLESTGGRMLIFTRRKVGADHLAIQLRNRGVECATMHADRTQEQRERALRRFKEGKVQILVATDIAARGLDVERIERVINFDFPQTVDDYVHRAGRTARAGRGGRATSLVEAADLPLMRQTEELLGARLPRVNQEGVEVRAGEPTARRRQSARRRGLGATARIANRRRR